MPFHSYFDTAAALNAKGLECNKRFIPLKAPRSLTEIRKDLHQLLIMTNCSGPFNKSSTRSSLPFAMNHVTKLENVLTTEYPHETDFDAALFEALRGCLQGYDLQQDNTSFILLKNLIRHDGKYAVGFARRRRRQVCTALNLLPNFKETPTANSVTTSTSASDELQATDHAVCLFEQDGGNTWKVKECFTAVELNMSDTSCEEFHVEDNSVPSIDLECRHGALGQAMLYTMGSVVLYHARSGISEASIIPIAVIAGRRKGDCAFSTKTKRPRRLDRLRWVSALLYKPEACGGRYTYSVEGFGHFYDKRLEEKLEKDSVAQAVRVYLDALLFGLKLAVRVRDSRNNGTIPLPVPASGQIVKLGTKDLTSMLKFCASPIPGAQRISEKWTIKQGDLFEGSINLGEILNEPNLTCVSFLNETDHTETRVLVKISSKAVHSLLIDPATAMSAIQLVSEGEPAMVQEIGTVLLAAIRPNTGLVTIMSDLSESFGWLSPKDNADHLSALWSGFSDLVHNVLLPMAAKTIVHPDIRPGYDVTFNILCRLTDDGDHKKAILKLIDFESLTEVQNWEVPMDGIKADGRYIPRLGREDAITYVWWQCIFIAYVWKEKINADDVARPRLGKRSVMSFLTSVLLRNVEVSDSPAWLLDLRQRAQETAGQIDAACVKDTLVDLSKLFR
jgi:hypothetical protein